MAIAIFCASADEEEQLRPALELLESLGCPFEVQTVSMWRDPHGAIDAATETERRGAKAILAAAGEEPALPGLVAAACSLPVIAVPVATDAADANASFVASVNAGAAVAIVAAGGARQAALMAMRILAAAEPRWRKPLESLRPGAGAEPSRRAPSRREAPPIVPINQPVNPIDQIFENPDDDDVPVYDLTDETRRRGDDEPVKIRPAADVLNRPLRGRAVEPGEVDADDEADAPPVRPSPPARQLGRIKIDPDSPDVAALEDVVDCLLEGGVIAFPTETVYGLAADATNPAAVEKLFALKGRERTKAISLMVDSGKLLSAIAQNVTVEIRRLMEAFWPGPLTIVFQKRPGNFRHVSEGGTIGVRMPDHSVPLAIMQALARPLACTSANLAGQKEARTADEILAVFGDGIDAVLDAGPLPERAASTVLDVSNEPYRIVRRGAITPGQLAAVVGEKLEGES